MCTTEKNAGDGPTRSLQHFFGLKYFPEKKKPNSTLIESIRLLLASAITTVCIYSYSKWKFVWTKETSTHIKPDAACITWISANMYTLNQPCTPRAFADRPSAYLWLGHKYAEQKTSNYGQRSFTVARKETFYVH